MFLVVNEPPLCRTNLYRKCLQKSIFRIARVVLLIEETCCIVFENLLSSDFASRSFLCFMVEGGI